MKTQVVIKECSDFFIFWNNHTIKPQLGKSRWRTVGLIKHLDNEKAEQFDVGLSVIMKSIQVNNNEADAQTIT